MRVKHWNYNPLSMPPAISSSSPKELAPAIFRGRVRERSWGGEFGLTTPLEK
jgi:hypothetical protein